jgi:hypothetical protein
MGLPNMRTSYFFLIDSDLSKHNLFLNGEAIGTFATLGAAEAAANKIANNVVPCTTLRFDLDFKSTLSDLEIRAATLQWESEPAKTNN